MIIIVIIIVVRPSHHCRVTVPRVIVMTGTAQSPIPGNTRASGVLSSFVLASEHADFIVAGVEILPANHPPHDGKPRRLRGGSDEPSRRL